VCGPSSNLNNPKFPTCSGLTVSGSIMSSTAVLSPVSDSILLHAGNPNIGRMIPVGEYSPNQRDSYVNKAEGEMYEPADTDTSRHTPRGSPRQCSKARHHLLPCEQFSSKR